MSSYTIEIIVFNEHTIGYREPGAKRMNILHASVLKGANWCLYPDINFIDPTDKVRLATPKDFKEFLISEDGYRRDPKYIYDRDANV